MKFARQSIQWLVFTNLYIALAAVCFQLAAGAWLGLLSNWHWMLSLHTLFSTALVYQFSRWTYHQQARHTTIERDPIYHWLDSRPAGTQISIAVAALGSAVTLFWLKPATWAVLAAAGAISMAYPVKLPGGVGLRSIPYFKIFLIAIVWSVISVWAPVAEHGAPAINTMPVFLLHFVFIVFITLPFDMADMEKDRIIYVKTIPQRLGLKSSRTVLLVTGFIWLPAMAWYCLLPGGNRPVFLAGFTALTAGLALHARRVGPGYEKWRVMAIYDGSMIVYFLLTLLLP